LLPSEESHSVSAVKTPLAKHSSLIAIVAVTLLGTLPQWNTIRADPARGAIAQWESDGPNVRIMRHQDGSKTIFRRSANDRKLIKKTFSPNGAIRLVTVYHLDIHGNPRGCDIFDGQETHLYKFSYGYNRKSGRLEAERMFDARVRYLDEDGNPMPVRTMIYTYDAHGNRSKAQAFVHIKGHKAEDLYDRVKTTYPDNQPFKK
jgi:hypothetical protein